MSRKKKATFIIMAIMSVLIICGLVMFCMAGEAGWRAGSSAIEAIGGIMDTNRYMLAVETATRGGQIGGAMMAAFGGAGFLICIKSRLDDMHD